jgi:hypothetical protein
MIDLKKGIRERIREREAANVAREAVSDDFHGFVE